MILSSADFKHGKELVVAKKKLEKDKYKKNCEKRIDFIYQWRVLEKSFDSLKNFLITNPKIVNQLDQYGKSLLYEAIEINDMKMIDLLLELKAEINMSKYSPICLAVELNQVDIILKLCKNDGFIDIMNENNECPSFIAFKYGHFDLLKMLFHDQAIGPANYLTLWHTLSLLTISQLIHQVFIFNTIDLYLDIFQYVLTLLDEDDRIEYDLVIKNMAKVLYFLQSLNKIRLSFSSSSSSDQKNPKKIHKNDSILFIKIQRKCKYSFCINFFNSFLFN